MKTSAEDAKKATQVTKHAGSHNMARLSRPGCYASSISPKGYQIDRSDPSGIDISAMIAYDYEKGDLLLRYVDIPFMLFSTCAISQIQLSV